MNSNVSQPIVQEPSIHEIEQSIRNDARNLIDTCPPDKLQSGFLIIPSAMPSFTQTEMCEPYIREVEAGTTTKPFKMKKTQYTFKGKLHSNDGCALYCPVCGERLVNNGTTDIRLDHIPINSGYSDIVVTRQRMICSNKRCSYNWTEPVDFKDHDHRITVALENMVCDLLRMGMKLKDISILTGLHKNTVKEIDKRRLQDLYTVDGKELKKPKETCEYLGIDEFLLHKGYKYATIIIDLKTGHVLYLDYGKKKQSVYDFIEWVGMDWMESVKAVACDMNSDYEEAFREKCSWIDTVYDHFHVVKNFNDKVISEVRKDEQKRLIEEGNPEAAKALKGSKYILMTTEKTRKQKEKDAKEGRVISRENNLFGKPEVKQKAGIKEEYLRLIKENELLFTADLVKEQLDKAYTTKSERGMKIHINRIIRICKATENKHFLWFAKLLEDHYDGIITHARLQISTGKVEGTNQMIKTLRRTGYGYPDDEYFFLKIIDSSRRFSPES